MIIEYAMTAANYTLANFKADISGLIAGTITTVSGLSSSCDKTKTTITGTYPTGIYTLENGTTFTFSKVHHRYSGVKHYFRLGWTDASKRITSIVQSQSYTSGTDTLVNSYSNSVAITATPYYPTDPFPIKLVLIIGQEGLFFYTKGDASSGYFNSYGIIDITKNALSAYHTNSMLQGFVTTNYSPITLTVPYIVQRTTNGVETYTTVSYSASTPSWTSYTDENSKYVVPEAPYYVTDTNMLNQTFYLYGIYNTSSLGPTIIPYDYKYNSNTRYRFNSWNGITVPIN